MRTKSVGSNSQATSGRSYPWSVFQRPCQLLHGTSDLFCSSPRRNGISETKPRSPSASGTPISCTTLSEEISKPSKLAVTSTPLPLFLFPSLTKDLVTTRNFSYSAVHADGAERIARITAQTGVPRFVHLSHLNASRDSPSKFYQSKAEGEERVKAAFEGATIVRPSTMFGAEDKLLNNMASTYYFSSSYSRKS